MSWTATAGIATGALVALGLLWGLWLHEARSTTGSHWTPMIDDREENVPELAVATAEEAFEESYTWEVTFDLPAPGSQRVIPHLPWRQTVSPWREPGATVFVSMTLNGEQIHAEEHRNTAGSGIWATSTPAAQALADVELGPTGNTLVIDATVTRGTHDGSAVVALGPATYETVPMDEDGDGIADTNQPIPGVHTGLLAGPLALLGGIGAARTTHCLIGWTQDRRRGWR